MTLLPMAEHSMSKAVAAVLAGLLEKGDSLRDALNAMAHVPLRNWNGTLVGEIRPGGALVS